jgi:ATP-binding cassette subfamily F protein uup
MNLLSIESISKSYSEKVLLKDISLGINEGDKIGVIGINGVGKSTFLKLVAGAEQPDQGRILKGNGVTMEYLPQNPAFDPEATVLEQVFRGQSPLMKLIREYELAVQNPHTSGEQLMRLNQEMDRHHAWSLESEAKNILTKLGITGFEEKVGTLSGGQRKRVAMASALINPSDLLILDEPTNHLDNSTIDWLEGYLNKRKGALLLITHDRYFLDRVVNEIVEIHQGNLYLYKGNYSNFLEKKLEREELEAAGEKKKQSLFKKELAWMRRGAKARTTKQKARIDRFEKLNDSLTTTPEEKMEINLAGSRLGKKVIQLEHIGMAYGEKKIMEDFNYILLPRDRVGIIGPNGSGKSTLINILAGGLQPDSGRVDTGETVKIGLFSQESYHMKEELRVIEFIKEGAEYLTTSEGDKIAASQMLERFLFSPATQWTPIAKLSGGEKRRLHLLRVLMEAPNVLLLDEPTNDLDIETLTILEDYIEGFPGAVMAVSHDRYFLDKVAQKILSFEGEGQIVQYTGNYTDVMDSGLLGGENPQGEKKYKEALERTREKALKFTYKEQREYEQIDGLIAGLEEQLQQIDSELAQAAADYVLLQQLMGDKEALSRQLEEKMERWMYLNELAERIEASKL